MIIVCSIVLMIVGIIMYKIWEWKDGVRGALAAVGVITSFAAGILSAVLIVISICANHNVSGSLAALTQEKIILEYRLDNELYLNDNNIGSTELFKDVTSFNTRVVSSKAGLQNPWISILYDPAYGYIEPIDINHIKEGNR